MSKTIRMSGARKNELQLHEAATGYRIVTEAIASGFNYAHKDVVNVLLVNDGQPHPQKVAKNGISMTGWSVGNARHPSVTHRCEWTQEYIDLRTKNHEDNGGRGTPYIGDAGRSSVKNTQITDAEGNVQKVGKGFVPAYKYKYTWQPHVEAGLMIFLNKAVTGALRSADTAGKRDLPKHNQIGNDIVKISRALAYLKMDSALLSTEAENLVSKRASPYENGHYILRASLDYGNSDYGSSELLKLPHSATTKAIKHFSLALPLMRNLQSALHYASTKKSNSDYSTRRLSNLKSSLEDYQAKMSQIIDTQVAEHGSLEKALEVDTQRRAEIIAHLKATPHTHLIDTEYNDAGKWIGTGKYDPEPSFKHREGLGVDIEKRKELIENTKIIITKYEAEVAKYASNLGDLKMQVAVGELHGFALSNGWIKPVTAGDDE